jgi:hypothetical protein
MIANTFPSARTLPSWRALSRAFQASINIFSRPLSMRRKPHNVTPRSVAPRCRNSAPPRRSCVSIEAGATAPVFASLSATPIGGANLTDDSSNYDPTLDAPCLDFKAACAHIGARPSTLRQKLLRGIGPRGFRLPGSSRWRFTRRDLDTWMRAYQHSPTGTEVMRRTRLRGAAAASAAKKRSQQQARTPTTT